MRNHTEYPREAGIYKLVCKSNGKIYIGKSVSLYTRLNYHKNCANKISNNGYLKNAIRKYGWDSFGVEILETFKNFDKNNDHHKSLILEREAFFIKIYNSTNKNIGYNICKVSTDRTGVPIKEETRQKLRLLRLGKKSSDETRKRMSEARRGKKLSDKHKQSLKEAKARSPMSEEHKEKLLKVNLGRKLSEDTKRKIGQAQLGKVVSEETRERQRRPCSEETKEKIRKGNIGKIKKPWTEEQREKIKQTKLKNKQIRENIKNESRYTSDLQ